jgi:hypothetical protein
MVFLQTPVRDPGLEVEFDSEWQLSYDLTNRSRIRGLGDLGFSFLNTSDVQPVSGAGYVGAALLALRTVGVSNIYVVWTGGTVEPNNRLYGVRLQYRVGTNGVFKDLVDEHAAPVQYLRTNAGHAAILGPSRLPGEAENQRVVQLLWRYFYIPSGATGQRAELRVDDIVVASQNQPGPLVLKSLVMLPGNRLRAEWEGPRATVCIVMGSQDLDHWEREQLAATDPSGRLVLEQNLPPDQALRFYRIAPYP